MKWTFLRFEIIIERRISVSKVFEWKKNKRFLHMRQYLSIFTISRFNLVLTFPLKHTAQYFLSIETKIALRNIRIQKS